ncbi:FecR family protein [Flavivirga jejuensis]|uniref:FecR domain-containing protein n=1 Tax=Flavivirga jejuensis TaxID=870487 RepID=A0ABT8WKN0_9FLAO|nr:FecR domain-containing protein [Flavivirga jejuensis]MDO5973512.1 FecR domain-containing protein [Flavivirga jejuensis]
MATKKIEHIITKYLTNQATTLEVEELTKWIEDDNNKVLFHDYLRLNYAMDYRMRKFNTGKTQAMLNKEMAKEKQVIKLKSIRKKISYAVAAVLIGIITTTYFFRDSLFNSDVSGTPVITKTSSIEPGTYKAILTLEDGIQVTLNKGESFQIPNASSNGEKLIYNTEEKTPKKRAYHYLTVPRGGQFNIKLSDGTQVWLNSESQLKYPVAFTGGQGRQVDLVYGEAYFDVSPSSDNGGSRFKVLHNAHEVDVIGTEFNIKAYKDDTSVYTTLVEGKVAVNYKNKKQNLKPNQQSSFNLKTIDFQIKEVDVYNEVSWKDGFFSFERKSLKEIMAILCKWYDVEVIFNDKSLEDVKFFGVLDKTQKMDDILETIKKFKIIKSYEIKDRIIILK